MRHLRLLVPALAACTTVGAVLYTLNAPAGGTTSAALRSSPGPRLALGWRAGRLYRYDLAVDLDASLAFLADGEEARLGSRTDVEAQLVVRAYGADESGGTLLGLELARVQRAKVTALGQELLGSPDELAGHELVVRLDGAGVAREVLRPADSPALPAGVVSQAWKALELAVPEAVRLAPGASWQVEQHAPFGTAATGYRADGVAGGGLALARERRRYLALDALAGEAPGEQILAAHGELGLAPAGHLASLREEEELRLGPPGQERLRGHSLTRLRLTGVEAIDRETPALAGLVARGFGEVDTRDLERALLESRIDGMTREQVLADLGLLARGGLILDRARWVWRTLGLLQRSPELCAELVELALADGVSLEARTLVLDLLAGSGGREAQDGLRRLLAAEPLRREASYPLLVQRTSFLAEPTRETVDFVRELHGAEDRDLRLATAYSLGTMSGKLAGRDPAAAAELAAGLRAELARADEAEREHLIIALGAAGRAEDLPILTEASGAANAEVRGAAAEALADRPEREATDALLALAADGVGQVQERALRLLSRRPLAGDDVVRLADIAVSGRLSRVAVGAMFVVLAPHADETLRPAFLAIARAGSGDADLIARVNRLLAAL